MEQVALFDDADEPPKKKGKASPVVVSEAQVRELAREYFNLPTPPGAEPPFLRAKREQAARESGADRRGLVAKWSPYEIAKGYVAIHDPVTGEWHDVSWKDAPSWAKWEARKRAELYKAGDRHAYDLTSSQMQELWREEHPPEPDFIVEEHPLPE